MKTQNPFWLTPLMAGFLFIAFLSGCTTKSDPVTDIDGNVYKTVIIGDQEWFAENLKTTRYNDGSAIPNVTDVRKWAGLSTGAYCWYENDQGNADIYGALYNWHAVNTVKLCPEGWRVPTDEDWKQLIDYIMDEYDYHNDRHSDDINGIGNALKSCRMVGSPLHGDCDTSEHPRWDLQSNYYGFDEFGFSALPGGHRWPSGSFSNVGGTGIWWSGTKYGDRSAWCRGIDILFGSVLRVKDNKSSGFSVRCLRDK